MNNGTGSRIEYIVMHHSLTKDNLLPNWHAIRTYHKSKLGWMDIGYHFGVELWGDTVEAMIGRSPFQIGAHTKQQGMNRKSLGVCVVGSFDVRPPDAITWERTVRLVGGLCLIFDVPIKNIKAHHDYASYKSCPGKEFPMDKLREDAVMWIAKLSSMANVQ